MLTRLTRPGLLVAVAVTGALAAARIGTQAAATAGDLAFLRPWFEADRRERETLAQRGVVVRMLPAADGQIAVLAVTPIRIDPDTFARLVRAGGGVEHADLISGTFSNPPVPEDLAAITLDDGDLDRLRRLCRPGDCRLNLADHEMALLQRALVDAARGSDGVQQAFRQVVADRARLYLKGGLGALPAYHDRGEPVRPAAIFAEILRQSAYLRTHAPRLASHLESFPKGSSDGVESFLRWSRATINDKAVIMVTDVSTVRRPPAPDTPSVIVAGKQVYASRYMNGELSVTLLFTREAGSPSYLVHVTRSELDELGGSFSGIKRSLIGGRIKHEAAGALTALRDALEQRRPETPKVPKSQSPRVPESSVRVLSPSPSPSPSPGPGPSPQFQSVSQSPLRSFGSESSG